MDVSKRQSARERKMSRKTIVKALAAFNAAGVLQGSVGAT
jgi:DNA-binding transcriptional MocR family regulator